MPALILLTRANARHPAVIEDLLAMTAAGQQQAVDAAITMLTDLYANGARSSYARKLQGLPIWELKTHARGGTKGGTRVYFYFRSTGEAVVGGAETKTGVTANATLLAEMVAAAVREKRGN